MLDEGAARVYAAATHPVFSGNAYENLAASSFEQIVVTDTIPLRAGAPDNVRVLSVRRPAHRLDPPDLHRRLACPRSSAARTSCSEQPRSTAGISGPFANEALTSAVERVEVLALLRD